MVSGPWVAPGLSNPHPDRPLSPIELEDPLGDDGTGSFAAALEPIRERFAGHRVPNLEEVVAETLPPLFALESDLEAPLSDAGVFDVPAKGCPDHTTCGSRIQAAVLVHGTVTWLIWLLFLGRFAGLASSTGPRHHPSQGRWGILG
jgi:hypothetical protein